MPKDPMPFCRFALTDRLLRSAIQGDLPALMACPTNDLEAMFQHADRLAERVLLAVLDAPADAPAKAALLTSWRAALTRVDSPFVTASASALRAFLDLNRSLALSPAVMVSPHRLLLIENTRSFLFDLVDAGSTQRPEDSFKSVFHAALDCPDRLHLLRDAAPGELLLLFLRHGFRHPHPEFDRFLLDLADDDRPGRLLALLMTLEVTLSSSDRPGMLAVIARAAARSVRSLAQQDVRPGYACSLEEVPSALALLEQARPPVCVDTDGLDAVTELLAAALSSSRFEVCTQVAAHLTTPVIPFLPNAGVLRQIASSPAILAHADRLLRAAVLLDASNRHPNPDIMRIWAQASHPETLIALVDNKLDLLDDQFFLALVQRHRLGAILPNAVAAAERRL